MSKDANMSKKGSKDLILVEKAKNGQQSAFAELLERYRDSIYYLILKMVKNKDDAEDLTIEAFGKAFNKLSTYSPDYAFSTWLYKIASNNCIDFIRKKKLHLTSIDNSYTKPDGEISKLEIKSETKDPEETIIQSQKFKLMRSVVSKLKPKYKELIEKRYFEELSYEEISNEMNLPLGSVKANLFRARGFLADLIKNTNDVI